MYINSVVEASQLHRLLTWETCECIMRVDGPSTAGHSPLLSAGSAGGGGGGGGGVGGTLSQANEI